jgi:uncharacterized protein YdeI (YjbR/CyaY-like superfamily)
MTAAGYESIAVAKENGSWTILDEVEQLLIPEDLKEEFKNQPAAGAFFESLSKSSKKAILQWLVLAKRPETRQKRVNEVVELAAQRLKPKHVQ